MNELPRPLDVISFLPADEVASLEGWRLALSAGDEN